MAFSRILEHLPPQLKSAWRGNVKKYLSRHPSGGAHTWKAIQYLRTEAPNCWPVEHLHQNHLKRVLKIQIPRHHPRMQSSGGAQGSEFYHLCGVILMCPWVWVCLAGNAQPSAGVWLGFSQHLLQICFMFLTSLPVKGMECRMGLSIIISQLRVMMKNILGESVTLPGILASPS